MDCYSQVIHITTTRKIYHNGKREILCVANQAGTWSTKVRSMNLRQQLDQILPSLLPTDPAQALKGTELIRLIRLRLEGDYSDASLRFHFSALAGDPSSLLSKVEKSQGYFRRPMPAERPAMTIQQPLLASLAVEFSGDEAPLDVQRRQKVLAISLLHYEQTRFTPYLLTPPPDASPCDPWITPQLLLVDSPLTGDEDGLHQDTSTLRTRQLLGIPPLPMHAISISMIPTLERCRLQFFRAMSSTSWAHSGELLYAEAITDDALANTLRNLGTVHGLGITSLGLSLEQIDNLPPAYEIMEADAERTESLLEKLDPVILVPTRNKTTLDNNALEDVFKNAPHISELLADLHSALFSPSSQPV